MLLATFLEHNKISMNHHELALCETAIAIMTASVDPNHDQEHVYALLSDLNTFLHESDEIIKSHINLKALVIAICWHDTWKSTLPQTLNVFKFLFQQFWDGMGSALKFNDYVRSRAPEELPRKEDLELISYIIRRHGRFDSGLPRFYVRNVLEPKKLEARILRDLDGLESWNVKRLKHLEDIFLKNGKPRSFLRNKAIITPLKIYYKFQYTSDASWKFNFQWSVKEYQKRKDLFLTEIHKVWKRLHEFYHMPLDLI